MMSGLVLFGCKGLRVVLVLVFINSFTELKDWSKLKSSSLLLPKYTRCLKQIWKVVERYKGKNKLKKKKNQRDAVRKLIGIESTAKGKTNEEVWRCGSYDISSNIITDMIYPFMYLIQVRQFSMQPI